MRLTIDRAGRQQHRARRPAAAARSPASRRRRPRARRRGGLPRRSYLPGEPMELRILADAGALTLQFLHCGAGVRTSSERNDEMVGRAQGRPGADRLDRQALGAGDDHRSDRRLADRALHRPARRPTTAASASRRSSSAPPTPGRTASSSSCRPTPGRPTTCTTATATAGATRGTPAATHRVELDRPYRDRGVPPRFQALRPRASSAGCTATGKDARHGSPTTISRRSPRATSFARSTTSSSSRGTAST